MTLARAARSTLLSAVLAAVAGTGAPCALAAAGDGDLAALRAAMEQAFAAAERDHARVRARDFGDKLGDFPARLAALLESARRDRETATAAKVDRLLTELRKSGPLPLSGASLRIVLHRLLPADATVRESYSEADCRDEFVAEARDVFAAERFDDCWDAMFGDLPEVAAWRAAHPPPPSELPAPAEPGGKEPTGPSEPPRAPEIPPPEAPDPTVNLLSVDRARGWVGPWTGWTQDIPEKSNRRQKRPAKTVWIDRYEVTCAEYLRYLRSVDAAKRRPLLPVGWTIDEHSEPACPPGKERHPVTGVTFFQAQDYAESVGKRLPTEDEWDRAAAGGEKEPRAFPWGASGEDRSWAFAGQGSDGTVPVDAHPDDRTPEGVIGLAGNVSEMVATLPDRGEVPAKLAAGQQVVVRGGNWRTPRESDCGTSFRWVVDAAQGANNVGFRCVMDESEYRRQFK